MQLTLLLNLFFVLLLAMLAGLTLLSLNLEHILERIIVTLCLFWEQVVIEFSPLPFAYLLDLYDLLSVACSFSL